MKRNEAREIVVEYVYRAKRKEEREWRPGYGQCRFFVGDSGEFAIGGGFCFAGEEQPPRRRDYEMQRLDHRLLEELGVERLTFREESLRKLVPRFKRRFGTRLVQIDSEFAPAVRARRQR